MNCSKCGVPLIAINMSDDEDLCQKCFEETLMTIPTNDESYETKYLSDNRLNEIINSFKR